MLRFRHFRSQLLVALVSLVVGTAAVGYVVTRRVSERNATEEIERDFAQAARTFLDLVEDQNARFGDSAAQLGSDYALKTAIAENDLPTLHSALPSYLGRSRAHVVLLVDAEGTTLGHSGLNQPPGDPKRFAPLLLEADATGIDRPLDYVYFGRQLHGLVFAPIRVGEVTFAWLGLGYRIDDRFLRHLKALCGIDLSFVHDGGIVATTLEAQHAQNSAAVDATAATRRVPYAGEVWLVKQALFPDLASSGTTVLEMSSLDARLAPTRAMLLQVLLASLAVVAASVLLALWIARGVSHPVQQLAAHTRFIAAGDYARRIELARADELGQLAVAFNEMSAGLAERDRVRDLLDKNVSPEVAAQLMRDGSALGGEEREVTILFADLRGFTPLSEAMPPRELVALLNRYLDRMSAAIEQHGGVIDKFIGDEIMALFGAPVTQNDAPDRALAAALAMEHALARFNAELGAEGRPGLAIGIGVNTARVVAGNIGSQRRLNYSVIGDGVNVAARLQSLTRTAGYRTNIITSAATLGALRARNRINARSLGSVQVKGRSEAVEIFAVA